MLFLLSFAPFLAASPCSASIQTCLVESASCVNTARDSVLLQTDHVHRAGGSASLEQEGVREPEELQSGFVQEDTLQYSPSADERAHFDLVRNERAQGWTCGDGTYYPPNKSEFKWDCRLARAARKWSQRMATENFIAHRKGESTSCTRTNAEGFPTDRGCGENIAGGGSTPQAAIENLKKSKDHCRNMFNPKFNKLGVGFASNSASEYKYYWTDSFGDWRQAPDQSCIGGAPAPSPAPGCADIDTFNCETYKAQGYCAYSPNVQAQCKETCNIDGCGASSVPKPDPAPAPLPAPPAPAPAPQPATSVGSCADLDGSCAYYRDQGYCASSDHIRKHCQKTCGLCSCADIDGACAYYRSQGYCSTDHIKANCARTCGEC